MHSDALFDIHSTKKGIAGAAPFLCLQSVLHGFYVFGDGSGCLSASLAIMAIRFSDVGAIREISAT